MESSKAKEAGRKRAIRDKAYALKDKPPRKAPAKEAIKQAGRYHAIEAAKKQLSEAQQTIAPDQEQQPYTAVDKVKSYTANIVHEVIQPPDHPPHRQHGNVSHRETHSRSSQSAKAVTPKERMRRQMVQEFKKRKAEVSREQTKNLSHGETHFEVTEPSPAMPKDQMRQSYLHSQKRKQETAHSSEKPISDLSENDLPTFQNRSTAVRQEQANINSQHRRTREDRKQITGQRQRALPRDTSSAGTSKAQIIKEQGRRYARDQAIKEIKTSSAKGAAKAGNEFIQKLGAALSRAVRPSSDDLIMYGGFALIMIVPLIMLAGIAVALFGNGEGRSTYVPVSAEVEAYTPIIQIYANQYGIPEYTELIKAVMMQESGGQGTDPMQCSESGYNTLYPHAPNSITDPEYSIDVGVHTLADVLNMAGVESPIDLDHISLALQGYNFGPGYISWALANYGGYSELNAIEFSDMMAAQYGWAGYGDKAYVSHVLRYYPIGRYFVGEGSAAMVAVAQSQIGNVGGAPYWSWWGYNDRVEWCAIFVSWVADQCGYIETGVLPKAENVNELIDWFVSHNQWLGREYVPLPGDLIFFDWNGDNRCDHVGIVEYCENSIVFTIEGNTADSCDRRQYATTNPIIVGYGGLRC